MSGSGVSDKFRSALSVYILDYFLGAWFLERDFFLET